MPATSVVFYSLVPPVTPGLGAQSVADTAASRDHEALIPNLINDTAYYFLVWSEDASGTPIFSRSFTFTTPVFANEQNTAIVLN